MCVFSSLTGTYNHRVWVKHQREGDVRNLIHKMHLPFARQPPSPCFGVIHLTQFLQVDRFATEDMIAC